jgi:hypothetical protein
MKYLPVGRARRRITVAAAAGALLALGATTGCNSGSVSVGSGVVGALEAVSSEGKLPKAVSYVNAERARELSRSDKKKFAFSENLGSSYLTSMGYSGGDSGLRAKDVDVSVETGDPSMAGHWTGRFDAPSIIKKLKTQGYRVRKEDGGSVLTKAGSNPIFKISKTEVLRSHPRVGLRAVQPKDGKSLADKPDYRRVAECLGEKAYRADFAAYSADEPVKLWAVGQYAKSPTKTSEMICAASRDEKSAKASAARVRKVIARDKEKYPGAKVTVDEGDRPVVKVAVPSRPGDPSGRVLQFDFRLIMALTKG